MSFVSRTVNALLLAGLLLSGLTACASRPAHNVVPGQPVTLQPGERVDLPDAGSLRYLRVSADSRCRPDVQCIRAGDADVAFEFIPAGGAPVAVQLNMPEATSAAIGRWQLHLLALGFEATPHASIRIDAGKTP